MKINNTVKEGVKVINSSQRFTGCLLVQKTIFCMLCHHGSVSENNHEILLLLN